jgi:hypothetical protein
MFRFVRSLLCCAANSLFCDQTFCGFSVCPVFAVVEFGGTVYIRSRWCGANVAPVLDVLRFINCDWHPACIGWEFLATVAEQRATVVRQVECVRDVQCSVVQHSCSQCRIWSSGPPGTAKRGPFLCGGRGVVAGLIALPTSGLGLLPDR